MAILSGIPLLHCQSMADTLIFYQQLLQFVLVNKRESEGQLVWAHLMHGETILMLQAAEQSQAESLSDKNPNISLYFFINNIEELHHLIKVKNYPLSVIETRDYQMQEFSLHDPEGNKITVGQKT